MWSVHIGHCDARGVAWTVTHVPPPLAGKRQLRDGGVLCILLCRREAGGFVYGRVRSGMTLSENITLSEKL